MAPMPQRDLFAHLIKAGIIDQAGVNDKPKPRTCRHCGADTLAAWRDGNRETIVVDPVALTPLGELQALTAGRRTFDHWGAEGGGLDQRRPADITTWPAGNPHHPTRPEHECGSLPLDTLPNTTRTATADEPPY